MELFQAEKISADQEEREMVPRKTDFRRQGTLCSSSRLINFLCNRESLCS